MDYPQALAGLHGLQVFGMRPGLERIGELLRRLGCPEREIGRYIHIAGTNGKGSTAAMLDAMLRAAGLRCGLFTSPHIHDHRERYRVDGELIKEAEFAALFARVAAAIRGMELAGRESPTEFEAATAIALLHFAESGVQTAVMETGLGGRQDSTNIIAADIAVLTDIGYDHMQVLGPALAGIAAEKAGIVKPGSSVFSAAQAPEAMAEIEAACERQGARLQVLGREIRLDEPILSLAGSSFSLHTTRRDYDCLFLPLLGRHQAQNAALAVAAAEQAGLAPAAIRQGLRQTVWPGRLELISREPAILLDGAHNQPGMAALAQALKDYWPGKRVLLLLGMLADKQREQAMAEILPLTQGLILTPPANSRSGDWQQMAAYARGYRRDALCVEDNLQAAETALRLLRGQGYDLLAVAGSLYLLADIRNYLLEVLA